MEKIILQSFLNIDSRSRLEGYTPSLLMAKKELKEIFNLNSYKWWRRHRKVVTYGGFLILFSLYLSPVIKEAKYKNDCINNSKKGLLSVWKNKDVGKDIEEKSGLPVEEFVKIEAYRNCNHAS